MADPIRVNNNQLSWGSITLKLNGDLFTGFTSISYSDKRERVKAYGMGRHQAPRGRSRGKYTVEPVKLVGWKGSIAILRAALAAAAPGGRKYGDTEFQIVVLYSEPDDQNVEVELNRCVWTGESTADEEGSDPLKEEIEVDCMYIRRNGLVLFDDSEGAPV